MNPSLVRVLPREVGFAVNTASCCGMTRLGRPIMPQSPPLPKIMKAAVLTSLDTLENQQIPAPRPRSGEAHKSRRLRGVPH